jgi:hypothetical protein
MRGSSRRVLKECLIVETLENTMIAMAAAGRRIDGGKRGGSTVDDGCIVELHPYGGLVGAPQKSCQKRNCY